MLFICGSLNQTTQMHEVARQLPETDAFYTPYYCDGWEEWCRRAGLAECTIMGRKLRRRCLDYLLENALPIDYAGRSGGYDLVVTCSDLVMPRNLRGRRVVVVQEGILDPADYMLPLVRRFRFLPRWLAGTASTGLSLAYERFCVASHGYRDHFVSMGIPGERIAVTGIPNFDDCRRYQRNDFPHRGYVLVCTSDARETFKDDDRGRFLRRCREIAAGRPLFFKLHPNENVARATREIHALCPQARVFASGSAEHMIANCDVLVTQYSSTVFVGLALGKECHSYFELAELRRLLPLQHGRAAAEIGEVVREVLSTAPERGTLLFPKVDEKPWCRRPASPWPPERDSPGSRERRRHEDRGGGPGAHGILAAARQGAGRSCGGARAPPHAGARPGGAHAFPARPGHHHRGRGRAHR